MVNGFTFEVNLNQGGRQSEAIFANTISEVKFDVVGATAHT